MEETWMDYGAMLMLMKVLEESRDDWNGYGFRLRIQQEINQIRQQHE